VGVLAGAAAAYVAVRRFARRQRPSAWIEFDSLRVSAQRDDAFRASRELRLDANERAVLLALVRRPGHIFAREDIAAIAWPDRTDVSPRLVSTLMDHLQRTVDGFDDAPLVHAVRGAGYVLSDPADTDDDIAIAIKPRQPQYAPPPHRRASRR
jgi:two-component system OmpR family response regulator